MSTAFGARSTLDLQGILQLVDCVYAAACGEKPWKQTVAAICEIGKLDGCAVIAIDRLARRRVVLASHGLTCAPEPDPKLDSAPGSLPSMDSVLESTLAASPRNHCVMSETLPTSTLCWTDSPEPEGLVSWASVTVSSEEREAVCLEVYAVAEHVSRCPELRGFLRQLAPHLNRAWRLGPRSRSIVTPPAPDLDDLPEAVRLRAEFGLTRAEARLALCLARGWSLATAAEAFDVKLTTIRSQLQQIFSKTGTSRQAEFVALLLSRGYGSRGALRATEVTQAKLAVAF